MDDVKPRKPWTFGQTGTTGAELEAMDDDFKTTPIEEMFPADSQGNRTLHGHSVAHTYEEMVRGYMANEVGKFPDAPLDPVVSEAQRRAMYAAAAGHSKIGIPKKVGQEFVESSHGLTNLPERKRKKGE